MGEILDDSKFVSIIVEQVAAEPGKLELVAYSVTPVHANPGDRFSADITIKNVGGEIAECRGKLLVDEFNILIDKEPDTYYKNLDPGESWTVTLSDILWKVPDMEGLWNLRVEAWRQV